MAFDIRDGRLTYKYGIDRKPQVGLDSFVKHFHTDYELLYFIHGQAEFVIEQERYSLRPHDLLVIKPGEYHNLVVHSSEERYERIVLRFNHADIPDKLDKKLMALSPVYDITGTRLSQALLRMDGHSHEVPEEYLTLLFKGLLIEILVYLCSHENSAQKAEYINEHYAQVIEYIDNHLTRINSLDDICAGLHMSRSTVSRLVHAQIHVPVMSYVRTKKCMLAHSLLTSGMQPTLVSEACGFRDYSSFFRAYKKVFQKTPSSNQS